MAPTDFDPWTQNLTFHYEDRTPFNVSVSELDEFVQYNTKVSLNYAAQIGASFILLVIVALMTKPDRRKSAVFLMNVGALLFNTARLLCMSLFFTSQFSMVYAYFAADFSRVPASDYATSILGVVLTLLCLVCLEASLAVQAHVICSTSRPLTRRLVLAASVVFAATAIGFRTAFVVENSLHIMATKPFDLMEWLQSCTNIAITASICFFSGVFIVKLGLAIRQRRRLGFKNFGPMQVIFIMGCQTMVVPSTLSISQYFYDNPEMPSNVITLAAISLPLSSMWATAVMENSHDTIRSTGKLWISSGSSSSSASRKCSGPALSTSTCPPCSHPKIGTTENFSPCTNTGRSNSLYPDLEAGEAIHVDRKFSVGSCRQ